MAYSDYGGYAYRNGVQVEERSDFTITPDGGFGTPGAYPGFALAAVGATSEQIQQARDYPNGHAVLGDGPIFLVLYKQSHIEICRGIEKLDEIGLLHEPDPDAVKEWTYEGKTERYVNVDHFKSTDRPCHFEVDGVRITIYWRIEDNHYQYAKLEQPDGTVWHGWSGYGVGAGLEDAGYGFSTSEREELLCSLWPEAIKEKA